MSTITDPLERKTVKELKELLLSRGLPVSGRKADLIARLATASDAIPTDTEMPVPPQDQDPPSAKEDKAGVIAEENTTEKPKEKKRRRRTGPKSLMKEKNEAKSVEKMTVAELKEMLRENGLKVTGVKAVLIKRLVENGVLAEHMGENDRVGDKEVVEKSGESRSDDSAKNGAKDAGLEQSHGGAAMEERQRGEDEEDEVRSEGMEVVEEEAEGKGEIAEGARIESEDHQSLAAELPHIELEKSLEETSDEAPTQELASQEIEDGRQESKGSTGGESVEDISKALDQVEKDSNAEDEKMSLSDSQEKGEHEDDSGVEVDEKIEEGNGGQDEVDREGGETERAVISMNELNSEDRSSELEEAEDSEAPENEDNRLVETAETRDTEAMSMASESEDEAMEQSSPVRPKIRREALTARRTGPRSARFRKTFQKPAVDVPAFSPENELEDSDEDDDESLLSEKENSDDDNDQEVHHSDSHQEVQESKLDTIQHSVSLDGEITEKKGGNQSSDEEEGISELETLSRKSSMDHTQNEGDIVDQIESKQGREERPKSIEKASQSDIEEKLQGATVQVLQKACHDLGLKETGPRGKKMKKSTLCSRLAAYYFENSEAFTVSTLKVYLRTLGQKQNGNKQDLIKRLEEALEASSSSEDEEDSSSIKEGAEKETDNAEKTSLPPKKSEHTSAQKKGRKGKQVVSSQREGDETRELAEKGKSPARSPRNGKRGKQLQLEVSTKTEEHVDEDESEEEAQSERGIRTKAHAGKNIASKQAIRASVALKRGRGVVPETPALAAKRSRQERAKRRELLKEDHIAESETEGGMEDDSEHESQEEIAPTDVETEQSDNERVPAVQQKPTRRRNQPKSPALDGKQRAKKTTENQTEKPADPKLSHNSTVVKVSEQPSEPSEALPKSANNEIEVNIPAALQRLQEDPRPSSSAQSFISTTLLSRPRWFPGQSNGEHMAPKPDTNPISTTQSSTSLAEVQVSSQPPPQQNSSPVNVIPEVATKKPEDAKEDIDTLVDEVGREGISIQDFQKYDAILRKVAGVDGEDEIARAITMSLRKKKSKKRKSGVMEENSNPDMLLSNSKKRKKKNRDQDIDHDFSSPMARRSAMEDRTPHNGFAATPEAAWRNSVARPFTDRPKWRESLGNNHYGTAYRGNNSNEGSIPFDLSRHANPFDNYYPSERKPSRYGQATPQPGSFFSYSQPTSSSPGGLFRESARSSRIVPRFGTPVRVSSLSRRPGQSSLFGTESSGVPASAFSSKTTSNLASSWKAPSHTTSNSGAKVGRLIREAIDKETTELERDRDLQNLSSNRFDDESSNFFVVKGDSLSSKRPMPSLSTPKWAQRHNAVSTGLEQAKRIDFGNSSAQSPLVTSTVVAEPLPDPKFVFSPATSSKYSSRTPSGKTADDLQQDIQNRQKDFVF